MKITTGIDIIEVERIQDAIDNMGSNFLDRVYTENEIEYCNNSKMMKYQHFAGRFAAKEAVFKAISDYVDKTVDNLWKKIEIINLESGKPAVNVDNLKNIAKKTVDISLMDIDISISHIKNCAVASVVAVFDKKVRVKESKALDAQIFRYNKK